MAIAIRMNNSQFFLLIFPSGVLEENLPKLLRSDDNNLSKSLLSKFPPPRGPLPQGPLLLSLSHDIL